MLDRLGPGGDDATEAAGWPFFGQLIAHDITADRRPSPAASTPRRCATPAPEAQPGDHLLGRPGRLAIPVRLGDPAKFLLGPDGATCRATAGRGPDRRPAQRRAPVRATLHVALLHAHNRIVERLRTRGARGRRLRRARITLTWHYQWIVVVHDFLPRWSGQAWSTSARRGRPVVRAAAGQAYIPLEFADAAFRYGHGQIRHTYRLVEGRPAVPLFPDLVGFGPLPAGRRMDLAQIFDVPGHPPRSAPSASTADSPPPHRAARAGHRRGRHRRLPSLAVRDLLRGGTTGLPSGEAVARLIGTAPLTADELDQAGRTAPRSGSTSSKRPSTAAAATAWARSAAGSWRRS